jgi:hypothetical protein
LRRLKEVDVEVNADRNGPTGDTQYFLEPWTSCLELQPQAWTRKEAEGAGRPLPSVDFLNKQAYKIKPI